MRESNFYNRYSISKTEITGWNRITTANREFAIIGGGIAGLTAAIALKQKGFDATIFEAVPEIKAVGAGLVLATNAMKALRKIGIAEDIINAGSLLPSITIYDSKGRVINKTNSTILGEKYGLDNLTIHRSALHNVLLNKFDQKRVYTGKKLTDVDQEAEGLKLYFEDGSVHSARYLVAVDGIHSVVRKKIMPNAVLRYAGYTCWRAVIDRSSFNLNETSETWGTARRFGLVPMKDNQLYWFACMNEPIQNSRMKHFTIEVLLKQFSNFHYPIPQVLKATRNEQLIWNDIVDLKPVSQFAFDKILLIGDAAHATTPNLGQGACQAIEDAVILADELSQHRDVIQAFRRFERRRIKRTRYIVNASRKIGSIAQLENNFLAGVRNFILRTMPSKINERQIRKLYEVDF